MHMDDLFVSSLNHAPGPRIEPFVEWRVGAHRVGKGFTVVIGNTSVVEVEVGHVAVHAEGGVGLVGGEGEVLQRIQ